MAAVEAVPLAEVAGGSICVVPVDLAVGAPVVGLGDVRACRPPRRGSPMPWRRCLAAEDAGGAAAASSRAGARGAAATAAGGHSRPWCIHLAREHHRGAAGRRPGGGGGHWNDRGKKVHWKKRCE